MADQTEVKKDEEVLYFPPKSEQDRLNRYDYYERLFMGQHWDAFSIKIDDKNFGKEYSKIRYVVANFAGLISKVIADMLFIEPPKIKVPDGDQAWVDDLVRENNLRVQNYESALSNSFYGDAIYKVRGGKRRSKDEEPTVIIEDITPKIYFPEVNPFNVKAEPETIDLSWKFKKQNTEYLRIERHTAGQIENIIYELRDNKISTKVPLNTVDERLKEFEDTKIDRLLVTHIPNWRAGNRHFGISDYYDLDTLFFAINNRISKIDNVLDTHSDPILAMPSGILDEDGRVRRDKLHMFERPEDSDQSDDPSYITWDANLESAFTQIDKLVEMIFMMSETSPDILGMGEGQAESGRALKLKLLRTLAKAQRKQLYYTEGLRQVIYTAQLLAKEKGYKVNGNKLKEDPVYPEIEWRDGLPIDLLELLEQEEKRLDMGISTKQESIMRVDDIDEDSAKKKADEIEKENELKMPQMNIAADTGDNEDEEEDDE